MEEPDINKIASACIIENQKRLESRISQFGKTLLAKAPFTNTFEEYLTRKYKKLHKTKNILYNDKAVPIRRFYVDVNLKIDNHIIQTDETQNILNISDYIIIRAPAGRGKTCLSRMIFLKMVEDSQWGIPVYLKLRKLNDYSDGNILDYIYNDINTHSDSFTREYFIECLNKGQINFILDGLDEVIPDKRHQVEKNILSLTTTYPNNRVFVFSRPSDNIEGWDEFSNVSVQRLTKDKALHIVDNINYKEKTQKQFKNDLESGLFSKYRDFLSNPLLLTLMLMTYDQIAGIPSKMHLYYERSFDILYNEHDVTKGRYKRKGYTMLPIDEFKQVLSAFAFITAFDDLRGLSISKDKTMSYLRKAKDLSTVTTDFDIEDYLSDLTESVCVLIKDGLEYVFTHRSFQEYFAALFISNTEYGDKFELIEMLSRQQTPGFGNLDPSELTFHLLYSMDREVVDRQFFIPFLDDLVSVMGSLDGYRDKLEFMEDVHGSIQVYVEEGEMNADFMLTATTTLEGPDAPYYGPHIESVFNCYRKYWHNIFEVQDSLLKERLIAKADSYEGGGDRDLGTYSINGYIDDQSVYALYDVETHLDKIQESASRTLDHLRQKYRDRDNSISDLLG